MALGRKAADEIRLVTTFFQILRTEENNELVITCNTLTRNSVGLVTIGLGPDEVRGPPVGFLCPRPTVLNSESNENVC